MVLAEQPVPAQDEQDEESIDIDQDIDFLNSAPELDEEEEDDDSAEDSQATVLMANDTDDDDAPVELSSEQAPVSTVADKKRKHEVMSTSAPIVDFPLHAAPGECVLTAEVAAFVVENGTDALTDEGQRGLLSKRSSCATTLTKMVAGVTSEEAEQQSNDVDDTPVVAADEPVFELPRVCRTVRCTMESQARLSRMVQELSPEARLFFLEQLRIKEPAAVVFEDDNATVEFGKMSEAGFRQFYQFVDTRRTLEIGDGRRTPGADLLGVDSLEETAQEVAQERPSKKTRRVAPVVGYVMLISDQQSAMRRMAVVENFIETGFSIKSSSDGFPRTIDKPKILLLDQSYATLSRVLSHAHASRALFDGCYVMTLQQAHEFFEHDAIPITMSNEDVVNELAHNKLFESYRIDTSGLGLRLHHSGVFLALDAFRQKYQHGVMSPITVREVTDLTDTTGIVFFNHWSSYPEAVAKAIGWPEYRI